MNTGSCSMLVPATINSLGEAELARIAREELGEDEGEMEAAVAEIRGWIASCPHLASTRQDDLFLRVFYRGCDYNMETVRAKYDLFYTARSLLPAWFSDWDPGLAEVRSALEAGIILPVRGYDRLGRFVVIIRQRMADPSIFAVDTIYKVGS